MADEFYLMQYEGSMEQKWLMLLSIVDPFVTYSTHEGNILSESYTNKQLHTTSVYATNEYQIHNIYITFLSCKRSRYS